MHNDKLAFHHPRFHAICPLGNNAQKQLKAALLEPVRDFGFGLQVASFISLYVKTFAVDTRLRLQILPKLK